MTPATRRDVVGEIVEAREGVSERRVCASLSWSRTSIRYSPQKPQQHAVIGPMLEVAQSNPAWGYRRVLHEVRRRGVRVSRRHFLTFYAEHRLAHRRRKAPRRVRSATTTRSTLRATQRNDIWAIDFMADQLVTRARIRLFVIVDEFTRELLALRVARSFDSAAVRRVLDEVRRECGVAPRHLRSDNGPEFIAEDMAQWRRAHGVTAIFSRPGKPVDNAICESTNGRIRAEFLNTHLFHSLPDAAEKAAAFRLHFNHQRPHSALNNQTPAAYAAQQRLS